ncbi:calmodulin-lysine N-methyltransferase [Nymphaea colorata]|nr:calmodulin-lysine N-methyltransferase [Nymphaea colorata]
MEKSSPASAASLRWAILRRALRPSSSSPQSSSCGDPLQTEIERVSRKATRGFNLVPWEFSSWVEERILLTKRKDVCGNRDAVICYRLPIGRTPTLSLIQRVGCHMELQDFEISNAHNIDSTGLVCLWPSEDVLTYYCLTHANIFSSKKVLELGSGYGLAGLAVAASTDAHEVTISDGNPHVVDYIHCSVRANSDNFGDTIVKPLTLHWGQEQATDMSSHFDIIIASDCTFFRQFHADLAYTIRCLLKDSEDSQAIFFSPRRGNTLDMFLEQVRKLGLKVHVVEKYDSKVLGLHQEFINGDNSSWPNYVADHCYPLMIKITF